MISTFEERFETHQELICLCEDMYLGKKLVEKGLYFQPKMIKLHRFLKFQISDEEELA